MQYKLNPADPHHASTSHKAMPLPMNRNFLDRL